MHLCCAGLCRVASRALQNHRQGYLQRGPHCCWLHTGSHLQRQQAFTRGFLLEARGGAGERRAPRAACVRGSCAVHTATSGDERDDSFTLKTSDDHHDALAFSTCYALAKEMLRDSAALVKITMFQVEACKPAQMMIQRWFADPRIVSLLHQ